MVKHELRTAILELAQKGLSQRKIARTLRISRDTVQRVIASGTDEVPPLERCEKAEPYRDRILELLSKCKGNLVRVHEELVAEGAAVSYQGLTSFCRRHQIGKSRRRQPAGRYQFEPGEEMQHDTSPHIIDVGGKKRTAQVASLVLCYSRMLYFQYYPVFKRFQCKVFLSEALRYFGGAASRCMIDNTHLVVLKGTGAAMVPVPEMETFAESYGFRFVAHEKGDADRSARVERPFHYIENNFEAGRSGADWQDWNRQALDWCDKVNAAFKKHLRATARELFASEEARLVRLPEWVPEVYELHHRVVDIDGYVRIDTNHYSVPLPPGRAVEVQKTKDRIDVYDGPHMVARHVRFEDAQGKRATDPAHRPPRGEGHRARKSGSREAQGILAAAPELADYVPVLEKNGRGPAVFALRRLLSMIREYPRDALVAALREAAGYGLYDLDRIERMVLKRLKQDFFLMPDDTMERTEHQGSEAP